MLSGFGVLVEIQKRPRWLRWIDQYRCERWASLVSYPASADWIFAKHVFGIRECFIEVVPADRWPLQLFGEEARMCGHKKSGYQSRCEEQFLNQGPMA